MVRLDERRARSIPALDRVGESVLDPRVDVHIGESDGGELTLHLNEERPDESASAVSRIDEDVEQARAAARPGRTRDREADQAVAIPEPADHGARGDDLTPHLARREPARAPPGPFERKHPAAYTLPRGLAGDEHLDGYGHRQRVTATTR